MEVNGEMRKGKNPLKFGVCASNFAVLPTD